VSDLERELTEAREQGVQATKEVQLAARQVVLENGRLRELLRLAGFSDEDINVWAGCGGRGDSGEKASCDRQSDIEQKARRCATFTASHKDEAMKKERMSSSSENTSEKGTAKTGHISETASTPHCADDPMGIESNSSDQSDSKAATAARPATAAGEYPPIPEVESRAGHGKQMPSCKLLTRLAENPAADITQIPPGSGELLQDAAHHGDIECRKAYEMLIHYATSEERMDCIARALEGGCTANGSGGCAVKSKAVLQALDDVCG